MRKPSRAFIDAVGAIGRFTRSLVLHIVSCFAPASLNSSRTTPGLLWLVLPLLLLAAVPPVSARTPSHTLLSNTVTAAWSNSAGLHFSAKASVTHAVSNLIDFNLSSIGATVAVGETTFLPIQIGVSNNFSDRFRLLIRTNAVTDMHVRFYADYNGNGLIDGADRPVTNTDPVGEGAVYPLLVAVDVPAWVPAGTTNLLVLEGVSFRSNAMLNSRVFSTNRIVSAVYSNVISALSAADRMRTITVLDGTASLADEDVIVTVHLVLPPHSTNSCRLWYDVGADPDGAFGPNPGDRSVPLVFDGADWTAVIPASDAEIAEGAVVRFMIEIDHQVYVPAASPAWRYSVRSRPDQGSGFNVFPTVVDLAAGDCLNILYRVFEAGRVRIQIYDLKGDLVKNYDEGVKQPGDYGPVLWCGDNHSGNPVAAGLYFINIRGKDLNETRKIIIIK
jgi:hypothetical protein